MKKKHLENLSKSDQAFVKKFKSRFKNRLKDHAVGTLAITGAFTALALIANGVVFSFGTHRVPFTRGTFGSQAHNKTIYTSNAAPEPGVLINPDNNQLDQLTYVGEARQLSEDTPDVLVREIAGPVDIPDTFHQDFDKDELYSEIIHDPVFMTELLELLDATRDVQAISREEFDNSSHSGFTITSFGDEDSIEATRIPREFHDSNGDLNDEILVEIFELISVALYLAAMGWWNIDMWRNNTWDRSEYRRLLKKAKAKK